MVMHGDDDVDDGDDDDVDLGDNLDFDKIGDNGDGDRKP